MSDELESKTLPGARLELMEQGNYVALKPGEILEPVGINPMELLKIAVTNNLDTEKISRLLDLQMVWEANQARKAYARAMNEFKKDAPVIIKNKQVEYKTKTGGTTSYKHASLDHAVDIIAKAIAEYGFSHSWRTENLENGQVKVTCVLLHTDGHSESTPLQAGLDLSGNKNNIQGLGSSTSYLERYTLLAITGLATSDDNDGIGAGPVENINNEQKQKIINLLKTTKSDIGKFLNYMAVDSVDKIKTDQYNKAMAALAAQK